MRKHAIHFNQEDGFAKQSFKDECDINLIMKKFQKSGAITHYAKHAPEYGAITQATLHDAVNIVADADTMFEELPSSIRKKFNNDPGQFLEFAQNSDNLEEMRKLGLANPSTKPVEPSDASAPVERPAPASTAPTGTEGPSGDGQES